MIKKEIHIFFAALVFFTRLPCPKKIKVTQEHFMESSKYFSLMGWIVGGFSALVYFGTSFILPQSVAILFSILLSILLTGGLHEDGLADVCDGFGGGWNKEKILSIMKDSYVGTYGIIGLCFVFLFKFYLLSELFFATTDHNLLSIANCQLSIVCYPLFIIIAAHSISRFVAVTFMYTHNYVRENEESKSKNVSQKMSTVSLIVASLFGIIPLFLFNNILVFLILIPLTLTKWLLARYFTKWIGGYTGDCLGATQQISEIVFYVFMLIAPWKYI